MINTVVMISVSKSSLSLNNLKILRPKVTKNLMNLSEKFCELPPYHLDLRMALFLQAGRALVKLFRGPVKMTGYGPWAAVCPPTLNVFWIDH